jgi:RNA polymerase sigma-70 factor (ECF subfamily)
MDTDEALCARAQKGETAAFDRLYARYEHRLFGFIMRLLNDRGAAEEVFHDTFLKVLDGAPTFDGPPRFSAWLFRVARNHCANHHRSRTRGADALRRLGSIEEVSVTPEDRLGEHERATALHRELGRLPETLTDVFHLRTSGLSYEEIAGVLEVPIGTVKSRMNALVTQLRGALS